MIVTVADAATKWCPMTTSGGHCEGSGCMWWRWEDPAEHVRLDGLPDDAYHSADLLPPRGYCAATRSLAKGRFG